ncbi:MAG: hypothetical protein ICV63_16190 [Coleofasciculus sp. Co-bin14]|nr:hypothetical protein [Coleofasciculus sp. Co-bin14]
MTLHSATPYFNCSIKRSPSRKALGMTVIAKGKRQKAEGRSFITAGTWLFQLLALS